VKQKEKNAYIFNRVNARNIAVWPEAKFTLRKQNWILHSGNRVAVYFIVTATSFVPSPLLKSKQHHGEGQSENFPCCSAVAEKSGAGVTAGPTTCIPFKGRAAVLLRLRRVVHRLVTLLIGCSSLHLAIEKYSRIHS